ncbi:Signal transduction histidine-protein kinase ArlS [Novipirellula galeiformis]|uniref:histidine kinase n=1 Tax=Novipirellula galeiformis TaxID=2528004 RepID=A0A5C6CCS9_9BACT|nr:HAMP domain-containing sensor histidine kinase [Novipirellula galeiformis]TWU20649.1 Signal transduction histidine-protein kinase ArlS [Novipirellula galeiformis]
MKLTTRVSAFFLATLAIALGIYSLVFYSLARNHIDYQFEHQLRASLDSLVAAAEVEETEVKWQPLEHSIALGSSEPSDPLRWIVIGDGNFVVEKSTNADDPFTARAMKIASSAPEPQKTFTLNDPPSHQTLFYQRLIAPNPQRVDRQLDEFDELLMMVGRPTMQRDQTVARLGWLVVLVPLAAWLTIAALGRWIVAQALRPLTKMSGEAQKIAGADFQTRLPVHPSKDELSNLGTVFNRLLDRQQIAFEQQRRFAGDAAHELRTPLTVLLGHIDITLRRTRTEAEYTSNLQLLRKQTISLQEIVESLLFLARSDEDGVLPRSESWVISEWLDSHWDSRPHVPRQADLELDNQLDDDTQIAAPASLLSRVLDNLVSNALKYSQSGTRVTVAASCEQGQVVIRVSDSGTGIAQGDLASIFDPFFRTAEARGAGITGNGLGLAIASRIAKSLGGSLECESKLGKGSTFTLRLPQA